MKSNIGSSCNHYSFAPRTTIGLGYEPIVVTVRRTIGWEWRPVWRAQAFRHAPLGERGRGVGKR